MSVHGRATGLQVWFCRHKATIHQFRGATAVRILVLDADPTLVGDGIQSVQEASPVEFVEFWNSVLPPSEVGQDASTNKAETAKTSTPETAMTLFISYLLELCCPETGS